MKQMGLFRLMIKDSVFYFMFAAMSTIGMNWYWLDSRTVLDMTVLMMQVTGLFTWTIFSLFNVELIEDRYKGYRILSTLPLTPRDILTAKLIPNFVFVMIFASSSWWLFTRLGGPETSIAASGRLLAVSIPIPLVVSALVYAAIFRFGYAIVRNVMIAVIFIGYISPIFIEEFVLPRTGIVLGSIGSALSGATFPAVLAAGIVAWVISVFLALRIKEKRYE